MTGLPQTADAFDIMSDRIDEAAEILKAMSSETRLKILCALSEGERPVNQLAELTAQSPSAVSQHLAKLRAAGLVKARRDAQTIFYSTVEGVGKDVLDTLCKHYKG